MPAYRLSYFNARGFAEVSRLTLAAAGQEWEDVRFKDRDEWLGKKSYYDAGFLPCLEVDGVQISQSQAILKYLAREYDLYGKGNMENTRVDTLLDDLRDFRTEIIKWYQEQDTEKKEKLFKELVETKAPAVVKKLETTLDKNGTGYLVGSKLTIADIQVFESCDSLSNKPGIGDALGASEKLKKHSEKVKENPGIVNWLKKRPVTEN